MAEDPVAADLPQEVVILPDVLAARLHLPALAVSAIACVEDFLHRSDHVEVAEVLFESLAVNVLLVIVPDITSCGPVADEVQLPLSAAKKVTGKHQTLSLWLC